MKGSKNMNKEQEAGRHLLSTPFLFIAMNCLIIAGWIGKYKAYIGIEESRPLVKIKARSGRYSKTNWVN